MKILVGCEESQVITKAFRAKGHKAFSCDLKPCSGGKPKWHIQDDLLLYIDSGEWDMMIAHPPCTFLTVSNTYISRGCTLYTPEQAAKKQRKAVLFFMKIAEAPIPRIVIENPIGIMSTVYRKPDQIIQPWQFGEPESKATCLWLKNMPRLKTNNFATIEFYRCSCGNKFPAEYGKYGCSCGTLRPAKPLWNNQTVSGQNKLVPSDNRSEERSKTYKGIADMMACQWNVLPDIVVNNKLF